MKSSTRILVVGVPGFNIGDDAICESVVASLRRQIPDLYVVGAIQYGAKTYEFLDDFLVLRRKTIQYYLHLAYQICRADLVVIGGGSIIQDRHGFGKFTGLMSIFYQVAFLAKFFGKPIITAPIGVDHLATQGARQAANYILGYCSAVFVRDRASLERCAEYAPSSKRFLAADPVFGFEAETEEFQPVAVRPSLVLSPAYEGRNEERMIDIHLKLIDTFMEIYPNGIVKLLVMDDREKEDRGFCQRLRMAIPPATKNAVDIVLPSSPDAVAKILSGSSFLIAMRLHSIILGYGRVSTFCLSRGEKTDAICAELGVPLVSFDETSFQQVLVDVRRFFTSSRNGTSIQSVTRSDLIARAGQFAKYAAAFLQARR